MAQKNTINQLFQLVLKPALGYNTVQINEWIPMLLRCNIDALTVHLRTRKEMSAKISSKLGINKRCYKTTQQNYTKYNCNW